MGRQREENQQLRQLVYHNYDESNPVAAVSHSVRIIKSVKALAETKRLANEIPDHRYGAGHKNLLMYSMALFHHLFTDSFSWFPGF